jgi:hypothetical protein
LRRRSRSKEESDPKSDFGQTEPPAHESGPRKESRMVTVAIGDIHGMYDMLQRLLKEIDTYANQEPELGDMRHVFLGDYSLDRRVRRK